MKNTILFLMMLLGMSSFGQDLKLEVQKISFWQKTNYAQPCAGYDTSKYLVAVQFRITNLSQQAANFPAYLLAFNSCRGEVTINDLITIQVKDKSGNVVHQHNESIAVQEDGYYYYFVDLGGCLAPEFPEEVGTGMSLSGGYFHTTDNSYPSGMQPGFSPYFVASPDTFEVKCWLNTPYFDRGQDCAPDTTTNLVFIDAANKVVTEVESPSPGIYGRESAPCTDFTPLTTAFMKNGVLNVNGSPCTEKHVIREINFGGGYIYVDMANNAQWAFVFTGNTWTDPTALSQKELDAYAANYPMYDVKKRGKASYQYKVWDDINIPMNQPLVIRKVNY
jgi:hypothetical protein